MVSLVRAGDAANPGACFPWRHSFEGNIVSVFELSAEVIHKGKAGKPNEFGKMVKLQESTMKSTFAAPMTPSC
jgi:hypothetical protein